MKKINPKILSIVLMIISLLSIGSITIHEVFSPGSGGFAPDPDSDGG